MEPSASYRHYADNAAAVMRRTSKVEGKHRSPRDRRSHSQAKRSYRRNMALYRRALAQEQRKAGAALKVQRTGRNRFGLISRVVAMSSVATVALVLVFFGVPNLIRGWLAADDGRQAVPGACSNLTVEMTRTMMLSSKWRQPVDAIPGPIQGCSVSTERLFAGLILVGLVVLATVLTLRKVRLWDPISSVGWGRNDAAGLGVAVVLVIAAGAILTALLAYAMVLAFAYLFGFVVLVNVLDD